MHASACTRLRAREIARTHTHRHLCNTYYIFTTTTRERASVLRYPYTACLVRECESTQSVIQLIHNADLTVHNQTTLMLTAVLFILSGDLNHKSNYVH